MNAKMIHTLSVAAMAALAAAASAETPATAQATTIPAPNWSTPEKTLLTWGYATTTQDGPIIIKSIAWDDIEDTKAYALQWEGMTQNGVRNLREMCDLLLKAYPDDEDVKKYVDGQSTVITRMEKSVADQVGKFEKIVAELDVKIDGDDATAGPKNGDGKPIKMKKIEGRWLVLPESAGIPTGAARKKQVEASQMERLMISAMFAENLKFKEDVKSKKYATGKEALAAMQRIPQEAMKRVSKEVDPRNAGSTQP